jgi:myosin heavy subunit
MAEKTLVYRINFDGLEAQAAAIGKVDSELTALNQTIKGQRDELSKQRAANEQNTQAYADLTAKLGENVVQQRNLSKAKGDLIRETQNEAKVLKENEGSIVSLRAQLSNLTKEYNNLTKAERESARGQDVQKQAKAVSDQLKTLESAIGDNRREVGNYRGALGTLESEMKQLIAQQQKLINSSKQNTKEFKDNEIALKATEDEYKKIFILNQQINNSFNQFNQQITNNTKTVNNYGLSLKDAGTALLSSFGISFGIGAAVAGLVALGKQLAETSKEVKAIQTTLKQTSNITGEALEDATIKVQLLSGAIGEDFNSVLTASNALSKQFGITTTEALDLIQDGFVRGANSNGEFLQSLKEYPAQFKSIGISAQESIDIITATANQGIYSDKGIDTIKEAGLALREQTKATQDALRNAFGAQFTDELLGNINNGSITLFQAIQSISGELGKLEPQSKEVGAVIADVFKGAGEDAGLAYLTSLKDIGNETKIVSEATKQLIEEQEKQLRLAEAQIRVTTVLSDGFNSLKSSLISYADEALTVVEQGNGFEKYLALLTFGFSATEGRAKELRDELAAVKAAQDGLFSEINTTDVLTIEKRLADLSKVVASGNDQFGFAAQAIEFYNKRLTELGSTTKETASNILTLESLQKKLTAAQEEFNKTEIGTKRFEKLRGEIKALQAQIEAITNPTNKGSINDLQKRVSELQSQLNNETTSSKIRAISDEIELLNKRIKEIPLLGGSIDEGDLTNFIPDPTDLEGLVDRDVEQIQRIKDERKKAREDFEKKFPSPKFEDIEQDPIVTEEQLKEERIAEIQANVDQANAVFEIAQNSFNALAALKDQEAQKNIDRINAERDAQIKQIQDSTLSEEQKALKIAEINKNAEAKAAAERKKNAESQKRLALIQIALDTGKAIAAAIATGRRLAGISSQLSRYC